MDMPEWPRPPIRPEDLPLIRELLTPEDYEALLKRIEADPARWRMKEPPNAAGTLGALMGEPWTRLVQRGPPYRFVG